MREHTPREFVLAYVTLVDKVEPLDNEPWSCSASGAVAARRRDIRNMLASHEKPYFDSDKRATP